MNEKVKYWLELSDYDYDTAVSMQFSGRYLYVGFMCHQTIEKLLKAYFNLNNPEPTPYSHSLSFIAKKAGIYEFLTDEFKDFIDVLEPLNIQTRYPSDKEKLIQSLTKQKCEELLVKTKELQLWIKTKF